MADMIVISLRRGPDEPDYSTEPPGTTTSAHILVRLDVFGDGSLIVERKLKESDHAGLIAEWEARFVVTILNTAIQAAVDAEDNTDPLAALQRARIGASFTPA